MIALARPAAKIHLMVARRLCVVLAALPSVASAETVIESALSRSVGKTYSDKMGSLSLSHMGDYISESGYTTQLSMAHNFIESVAPDAYGQDVKSYDRRASLSVDQTIDGLSQVGATIGCNLVTSAGKSNSRFYSLRLGHWWNKATLQTSFEMSQSRSEKKSREFQDTDFRLITTADRVAGRSYSLGVTWLATTYAMILARATTAVSSDRPVADFATLEGRYFISDWRTALHVKVGAYRDRNGVGRGTDYGQIRGQGVEGRLHQHLSDRWIGSLSHRRQWETETPRSNESDKIERYSSASQVRLRWRYVTGPVTENVSEVYVYLGQYKNNEEDSLTRHFGLGGKYVL